MGCRFTVYGSKNGNVLALGSQTPSGPFTDSDCKSKLSGAFPACIAENMFPVPSEIYVVSFHNTGEIQNSSQ